MKGNRLQPVSSRMGHIIQILNILKKVSQTTSCTQISQLKEDSKLDKLFKIQNTKSHKMVSRENSIPTSFI